MTEESSKLQMLKGSVESAFHIPYEDLKALLESLNLDRIIADEMQARLTHSEELMANLRRSDSEQSIEDIPILAAGYIRRQLVDRLSFTLQALVMEALHYATGEPMSISQLRSLYERVVAPTEVNRRADLPIKGRGGDRRTQYVWTNERYIAYTRMVDDMRILWDSIIRFYDDNDYRIECLHEVKGLEIYKRYSRKYRKIPEGLLQRILRRKLEKGRRYWPLTFALEHARREIGIEYQYSWETLYKFYKEGLKLRGPVDLPE